MCSSESPKRLSLIGKCELHIRTPVFGYAFLTERHRLREILRDKEAIAKRRVDWSYGENGRVSGQRTWREYVELNNFLPPSIKESARAPQIQATPINSESDHFEQLGTKKINAN